MRFIACIACLLISSVSLADDQRIYSGTGSVLVPGSDPETEPDGKRSNYLVSLQINEGGDDGITLIVTSVVREDSDPAVETLRMRKSGSSSFDILDRNNNQIGWAYEAEFEDEDSLKVHGLILNYRTHTDDDHAVTHYLRFTEGNGTLISTGSAVDRQGKLVVSWYDKMKQVHPSDQD